MSAERIHDARSGLVIAWDRLETWLAGPLAPAVRANMRTELVATIAYGAFATVLAFIPIVLRRLGATEELLALYSATAYLGNVLAGLGLILARMGQPMRLAVLCWCFARSMFLAAAFITNSIGLLIVAAVFWLAEGLPSPVYSDIIQSIYPAEDRGKVMAVVRLGMALAMLILAPVAGFVLDTAGYRVLFPVAGAVGVLSALIFSRLKMSEAEVRVRRAAPAGNLGEILLHDRRFALYLGGVVLFGLAILMPQALIPTVQVDRLHLTYTELGWLNVVASIARLVSYFYWGRLIDRWGAVRCLRVVFLINIIGVVPYIWVTQGWMLAPSFIASGLVGSGTDLGFINAAINLARSKRIQEYSALQFIVIGARGIVGPFVGVGLLRLGFTYSAVFAVAGGLTLLAMLLLFRINVAAERL